jgi:hypothetical protein
VLLAVEIYCCAVPVTGLLAADAAHKNKELNTIIWKHN